MSRWKTDWTTIGRLLAVLMVTLVVSGPATAQAQQPPPTPPQDEFVLATDVTMETLPATPLIYVAYAFVWTALLVYVFMLWQRIGKVERELADVNAKLRSARR